MLSGTVNLRKRFIRFAVAFALGLPVGMAMAQAVPAELPRLREIYEQHLKAFEAGRAQPGANEQQISQQIVELTRLYLVRLNGLRLNRINAHNVAEAGAFEAEIARVRALPEVVRAIAEGGPPAKPEPEPEQLVAEANEEEEGDETLSAAEKMLQRQRQRRPSGTLSDEDVAALQTTWQDEKTKHRFAFSASFHPVRPNDRSQINRYAHSGRVPFRIVASLYEIRPKGSSEQRQLVTRGNARFYVLDSEGKVVLTGSESLAKMCPT